MKIEPAIAVYKHKDKTTIEATLIFDDGELAMQFMALLVSFLQDHEAQLERAP